MKKVIYLFLSLIITVSCSNIEETELLKSNELVIDPTIEVVDGHIKFQTTESFRDLMGQMQANEKPELGQNFYAKLEEQGFCGLNKVSSSSSLKSGEHETVEDTLIPDPYFSSLLNENREIEVNGVVYKIHEFGTFFGAADRLDEINEVIENFESKTKSTKNAILISESLYEVGDGLYMFDSQRILEPIEPDDGGGSGGGSSGGGSGGSTTSNSPYDDIEYHNFDAHTIVGDWIQNLFGRTRAYNRTFSSTRRIRVNFYSVNYVVYSAIGINVKYQKKNWIGWSKTDCQELRMGWEGLEYSYKLPYSMPTTGPAPVRSEYTYIPGIKSKKAFTVNFLDHEISIDYSKPLKSKLKSYWNELEEHYAPTAVKMRAEELSQFRKIFPDKVIVDVNPYEEIKYNCSSNSKVFDWGTCEIKISFLNNDSWGFNAGLANNAYDFDIKSVSIYGIAKNGTRYKGIGIVKN